jgi:hypothetical protein
LKTQEQPQPQPPQGNNFPVAIPNDSTNIPDLPSLSNGIDEPPSPSAGPAGQVPGASIFLPPVVDHGETFGWDMISLGLEEPLPTREVIDELYV